MSAFRMVNSATLSAATMRRAAVHMADPRTGEVFCGNGAYMVTISSHRGVTCKRCIASMRKQKAAVTKWATS